MLISHWKPDIAVPSKPKLLEEARRTLRAKYYRMRTEEAYVGWMRRFILFHGKRHPREMGEPEVAAFLGDLATRHMVSASTQNQALSALLFLDAEVLRLPLGDLGQIPRARRPKKSPVVLTRAEAR